MSSTTFSGPVTSTNGFVGGVVAAPVAATASTLTVTAATHAGRTVALNRAAGIAVTLPAATGTGAIYRFVIVAALTSNTTTIKVANASDIMTGNAYVVSDGAAAVLGYTTGASDDTITLNGSTTGGLKGDLITVTDVATNVYHVLANTAATGTEATPFSATVA
jgi:hypothetical protein